MSNIYRNHKDNVFCLLYQDKANLLELYNSMNGTDYANAEELNVVTLPNAICMKYRNDAAYTFNSDLCLYEQQSTKNPNIPLRLLHYVSEEYHRIIPSKELHRKVPVSIPTPHFIVFYNGVEPQPEKQIYKLSDLYAKAEKYPELELAVTVLNINEGNNTELLTQCHTLCDYMKFVAKVRHKQKSMSTEEAVKSAVEECIQENILKDFFTVHKEEVIAMSIWEYDEELARQAAVEDGMAIGIERGMEKGMEKGIESTLTASIKSLMSKLKISADQAMDALDIPESEWPKYLAKIK